MPSESGSLSEFSVADPQLNGNVIGNELLRNMELGRFEMSYAVLLPCVFTVFLNPADYTKLQGVFPLIADDARKALRTRVAELNRSPSGLGLRKKNYTAKEHKIACSDWSIEFFQDNEVARGDLEIHSELSELVSPGFRGAKTTLLGRDPSVTQRIGDRSPGARSEPVHAVIHFQDDSGPQTFLMTANQVTVGRGGESEPVDLRLKGSGEISREHLVIRRNPATGAFTITDASTNGTWVNGKRLRKGNESILPPGAQILLGETLTLAFEVHA